MISSWNLSTTVDSVHALWVSGLATPDRVARLCGSTANINALRSWLLMDQDEAEGAGTSARWRIERAENLVPLTAEALAQLIDAPMVDHGGSPYLDLYVEVPEQGRLPRTWHRRLRDLPLPSAKTELTWTSGEVDLRIKVDRVQLYVEQGRAVGYGHLMHPWSRATSATVMASYEFQPPRPRKRVAR